MNTEAQEQQELQAKAAAEQAERTEQARKEKERTDREERERLEKERVKKAEDDAIARGIRELREKTEQANKTEAEQRKKLDDDAKMREKEISRVTTETTEANQQHAQILKDMGGENAQKPENSTNKPVDAATANDPSKTDPAKVNAQSPDQQGNPGAEQQAKQNPEQDNQAPKAEQPKAPGADTQQKPVQAENPAVAELEKSLRQMTDQKAVIDQTREQQEAEMKKLQESQANLTKSIPGEQDEVVKSELERMRKAGEDQQKELQESLAETVKQQEKITENITELSRQTKKLTDEANELNQKKLREDNEKKLKDQAEALEKAPAAIIGAKGSDQLEKAMKENLEREKTIEKLTTKVPAGTVGEKDGRQVMRPKSDADVGASQKRWDDHEKGQREILAKMKEGAETFKKTQDELKKSQAANGDLMGKSPKSGVSAEQLKDHVAIQKQQEEMVKKLGEINKENSFLENKFKQNELKFTKESWDRVGNCANATGDEATKQKAEKNSNDLGEKLKKVEEGMKQKFGDRNEPKVEKDKKEFKIVSEAAAKNDFDPVSPSGISPKAKEEAEKQEKEAKRRMERPKPDSTTPKLKQKQG